MGFIFIKSLNHDPYIRSALEYFEFLNKVPMCSSGWSVLAMQNQAGLELLMSLLPLPPGSDIFDL